MAATDARAELRVYLMVEDLQPQFAAYLGTPTRARGYPPYAGDHALIIEVAPALAIERVIDLALRAAPSVEPGILFVERQFGVLELHASSLEDVVAAGQAVLDGTGSSASDQLRPRVLFHDIIESITDQHAVILNRNRSGSMIMPGQSLLVYEMAPALFAAVAAIPSVSLVALQKGSGLEQIHTVPFGKTIHLPGSEFDTGNNAFLDTAALMASLDLVVTSDTAIAHLAGALGRPTFLALQRWPDWRWLLDRDDTPWYPSVRLFRQSEPGDWAGVFERIAAVIRSMVKQ